MRIKNKPSVAICLTCKNASLTIGYTLKSIALLNYPKDKIFVVIVDGGSTDGTVDLAKKILTYSNLKYKILIKHCNIPAGRNKCIDIALNSSADYILFLDADIIIADKRILMKLIDILEKHDLCIVSVNTEFITFKNKKQLDHFAIKILEDKSDKFNVTSVRAVPWCGMSLTLIPTKVARHIRFNEEMSFAEDRLFCFYAWKKDFPVYLINGNEPLAYDLNLIRHSDIYVKMGIREYIRGIYNKALMITYTYYKNGMFKTFLNFISHIQGLKICFHVVNFITLLLSLVAFSKRYLIPLGKTLISIYLLITLTYLIKLTYRCSNFKEAFKSLIKFRIYSLLTLFLMPYLTIKYKDTFYKIYIKMKRLNINNFQ